MVVRVSFENGTEAFNGRKFNRNNICSIVELEKRIREIHNLARGVIKININGVRFDTMGCDKVNEKLSYIFVGGTEVQDLWTKLFQMLQHCAVAFFVWLTADWKNQSFKAFHEKKPHTNGAIVALKIVDVSLKAKDIFTTPQKSIAEKESPEMAKFPESLMLPSTRFIAVKNSSNLYIVPSTKNYFGKIKAGKAIVDCGCSTILISIQKNEIHRIFEEHYNKGYGFSLGIGLGTNGKCTVLLIKPMKGFDRFGTGTFPVNLFLDRYAQTVGEICHVQQLRLHLCAEDAEVIIKTQKYHDLFNDNDKLLLQESVKYNTPRLAITLIGNKVLDSFTSIRVGDVMYFMDPNDQFYPTFLKKLEKKSIDIIEHLNSNEQVLINELNDVHFDDDVYNYFDKEIELEYDF
jgi:hypothetical protein